MHFLGAVAAYGARLVHRSRMRTADIRNGALHLLYCRGDTLDSYWRTVGLRSDAMMGGRRWWEVVGAGPESTKNGDARDTLAIDCDLAEMQKLPSHQDGAAGCLPIDLANMEVPITEDNRSYEESPPSDP